MLVECYEPIIDLGPYPTPEFLRLRTVYRPLIRPFFWAIDPERAHALASLALRLPLIWKSAGVFARLDDPRLTADVAGLRLPSPIGLAAGFDKNCVNLGALLDVGFGFVTGGTVTLAERAGNKKPRVVRLSSQRALVNALGFPNQGLRAVEPRFRRESRRRNRIFASISGTIEDEIVACYRKLAPMTSAVELNISSPNTAGLRVFHDPARLRPLIEQLIGERGSQSRLFVKLPPWEESEDRRKSLQLAETAVSAGAHGLVVANTVPVEHPGLAVGSGGLSGAPLMDNTERMTAEVSAGIGKDAAIISCGGVFSPEDVWRLIACGASAVQLYTAFIYEGPLLPVSLNRGLIKLMERSGITSLSEIRGQPY